MTLVRSISLLILTMFIAGCGVLETMLVPEPDATVLGPPQMQSEPPMLYLLRGDIAEPMDRGSYCWVTLEGGLCADMSPPIYEPDMHTLVIGSTLELLFDAPLPDTLTAALHPGSNLMTRIADIPLEAEMDADGRVLVTLPDGLDGDYVLAVFATWAEGGRVHGDAFYAAPVQFDS